ncbi:hypothetical protein [Flaviflagellibacter deserti]|uniref:Uncharacterized protein n=1 Tax=Flaviflagellibacter deserti TaxID=2267266 RepID=A0ABV9YYB9_9HYPH
MNGVEDEITAQARRLYEETSIPVSEIAALMRLGRRGFHKRIKALGWTPRRGPAGSKPAPVEPLASDPRDAIADRAGLIARIRETVDREIAEIDQSLKRLDRLTGAGEMERSAKTLATLVKTLSELKKLDEADKGPAAQEDDDPRDIHEFRLDLATRLDALHRSRTEG